MTASAVERYGPGFWSYAALILSGAGVVAATWLIFAIDSDPGQVEWPLVFAPVAITAVPVLVPTRSARILALVLQAGWCVLTGFSIGFLLLPALAALAFAFARESA
jgi:uncharacterized membrane protein